jgi:hypothetical protein
MQVKHSHSLAIQACECREPTYKPDALVLLLLVPGPGPAGAEA